MLKGRIDLRSDTVTEPTDEMRVAMHYADVGDDARGEDPTTRRLEAMSAEMLGKEAALFVTSGTQGNLVSLMAWTKKGDEIILEHDSHIFWYEVAGAAAIGGLLTWRVKGELGIMRAEDVEAAIRPENIHFPVTTLICLENTHNVAGGTVMNVEQMKAIHDVGVRHGIPIHLDGARIFNAAAALGVSTREIADCCDSVTFCLSKGLCCPVGAVVAGPKDFIERAKKARKMLGGGLRQSGVLAAAGIVALEKMTGRVGEDHKTARILAESIAEIPGVKVDLRTVQSNIVRMDTTGLGVPAAKVTEALGRRNVLALPQQKYAVRFVTHYYVTEDDVRTAADALREVVGELES
ncbi:MAG: aminotransferase class I/II-fold pyridoxal phosphate-dependent enzyme [Firmicutes bacterium]|nr:aminotransferase class I/II-fold pyridoxal phosphate-dependent enzyme [Bacillota bacterium]